MSLIFCAMYERNNEIKLKLWADYRSDDLQLHARYELKLQ